MNTGFVPVRELYIIFTLCNIYLQFICLVYLLPNTAAKKQLSRQLSRGPQF
jgi:hypothetical protein